MSAPLFVHARYEAGPLLGRGGQGVVLRVFDREAPERPLAAKIWLAGLLDESALAGEFALLRRLDIPGLVRAHDFGRDERTHAPFLVEDFVDGQTAQAFVDALPGLRTERLFFVISEVAATLAALHDAAFVHGDLKPEHVRVTAELRVVVLDLGAALAHRAVAGAELVALTPAFAAPEVVAGARPSRQSDLYSLGALAWALVTGTPPGARPPQLRRVAAWVPPSLADLIDQLLEPHPRDRPEHAERVLEQLGLAKLPSARRALPPPVGRARELAAALAPELGVRYLVGPSGCGKSHLLREVVTRSLLAGRVVRRVAFPAADAAFLAQLIAFLRGTEAAWPFTVRGSAQDPMLLALDGLHEAPPELVAALDAYRCRASGELPLDVIVTSREAPLGAKRVAIEPLEDAAFAELCRELGVTSASQIAEYSRMTGQNPGWLVAASGRVPLTRDMVLERARSLTARASELLAALALLGGGASEALVHALSRAPDCELSAPLTELLASSLVVRRSVAGQVGYALQALELAPEIAAALGSFEIVERVSALVIPDDTVSARALLALGNAPFPSSAREPLLRRAAAAAAQAGATSDEMEALFAIAASPAARSRELLLRLERLTRHAGGNHAQVVAWLVEAVEEDASLVPLLARRQAEQAARSGDFSLAERQIARAEQAAAKLGDHVAAALSLATRGAIALYRADIAAAESALRGALARIATLDVGDAEEIARIEHNAGVVALYGDRLADAVLCFERSLEIKRRLGDRAGVRSCLLNFGLALARSGHHERAARTLDEAIALAVSLGQHAGRAWCLAARADLEIRRGEVRAAERFIAEAEAVPEAPAMVRADLALLRGQSALLDGDSARALSAVSEIAASLRSADPLLDTRALLVLAGAQLASLPAQPRAAARLAVRVARAARTARLPEVEAQALALLRRARNKLNGAPPLRYAGDMEPGDAPLWSWLRDAASGAPQEEAVLGLLRKVRALSGAERALLATCDANGRSCQAWGVDLEGFPLDSALERCDADWVQRTADANSALYQRDVQTTGGRGSRLAVSVPAGGAAPRAVLLLEHRFRAGAFDGVSSEDTRRYAILAGLALRLAPSASAASDSASLEASSKSAELVSVSSENGQTTALPLSRRSRNFAPIVGESRALRAALAKLDAAVDSDLPVLIQGETGTGKELFARALHEHGARARAPFVALNCAAVSEALFESELFGHARGAFTGAERARPGLIARAEGGVLFLDELGELSPARQAALLRVLESRRYRPVGSDEERPFDARIVSATNRPLELAVTRGTFRQDLLFRINVIEIRVPALRERAEDIPTLVRAFLDRAGTGTAISAEALSALESYAWPGNVRELEHQIQRLLSLRVPRIELAHLPRGVRQGTAQRAREPGPAQVVAALDPRTEVERALALSDGNITHAAQALGLTRHGLKKRMLRLGLRAPQKLGEGQ